MEIKTVGKQPTAAFDEIKHFEKNDFTLMWLCKRGSVVIPPNYESEKLYVH